MSRQMLSASGLALLLIALACVLSSGCSSDKPPPAPPPPPPPATLSQIKAELTQARAQMDLTTNAMNALVKSDQANVQANYDKFNVEMAKLQSAADTCKSRSADLKTRTQAYYDTWNKQAEVQNADLRRAASEQRAEAERTFSTIKSEIELTKLSFDPYMSQLKDISSYLGTNKTPAALATASDLATKATANAAEVNRHVSAVMAGIGKIMTASGEGAPAMK